MDNEKKETICALGTGAMGAGTALCFAMAEHKVKLYGRSEASLEKGRKSIQSMLEACQQHNIIQESDVPAILGRIHFTTNLDDAARGADLVIESVAEELETKQKLFKQLDGICSPKTIFATNTSGLSPTAIAEGLSADRQKNVVVTHFWNPPHLIPLVEVVPGKNTSQETADKAYEILKGIGKEPVALKREAPGFVGNRIQAALLRESYHMAATEIASPEEIDAAVRNGLGRDMESMGPFEIAAQANQGALHEKLNAIGSQLCIDQGVPPLLAQAVKEGKLGAKTGVGVYNWSGDKLKNTVGRRTDFLFKQLRKDSHRKSEQPVQRSPFASPSAHFSEEKMHLVNDRLLAVVLREAAHIVAEGIATQEEVDKVVKNSLGRRLSTTGPIESADIGGLDIFGHILENLGSSLSNATDIPALMEKARETENLHAQKQTDHLLSGSGRPRYASLNDALQPAEPKPESVKTTGTTTRRQLSSAGLNS